MKIIKKGKDQRLVKILRFECWNKDCGEIFEGSIDDWEWYYENGQHDEQIPTAICPNCGTKTQKLVATR